MYNNEGTQQTNITQFIQFMCHSHMYEFSFFKMICSLCNSKLFTKVIIRISNTYIFVYYKTKTSSILAHSGLVASVVT